MKIYTGTGDTGMTSLFSGERVLKSHERLNAYGDLDELSSTLGLLAAQLPPGEEETVSQIYAIQSELLSMGAWLATTPDSGSACVLHEITDAPRLQLENQIDAMQEKLSPLSQFILPGGHKTAGLAHVARTMCRRAERDAVAMYASMSEAERTREIQTLMVYLNRLSDYLFVLARYCNALHETADITWPRP